MAFDFSLTQDHFTPIRPQKIERLFTPNPLHTPNRAINDITYQVPAISGTQITCDGDDTTIGLPKLNQYFPRQSTGIKNNRLSPAPSSTVANANETVAFNCMLDTKNFNQNDIISNYKPLYQIKDSQPTRACCFHPFGDVFVIGSNSKTLRICLYPTEEELENFTDKKLPSEPQIVFKFLQIHRGSVYCVAFNDTGSLLATGSNDQTVHVIKYNSKKHLPEGSEYKLTMHSGTVRDLCFMKNGGESDSSLLITSGAGDYEIYVTDCNTMKPMQKFSGHDSTVMSLHCWKDSTTFVSGSLDGTIKLWDVRSKRCASIISTNRLGGHVVNSNQNGTPVGVVRVEQTGKLLVSGHKDGRCMLYDIRGGKIIQLFKAHEDEIRTLNFSPKSYYLLTASYDHKIKLIDLQGDLTRKLPSVDIAELNDKVVQTTWHPDEYTFVTTSADGSAALWTMPEKVNIT